MQLGVQLAKLEGMKTFFTADLHLGHGNIIKYCQRPFMTPEETALAQADPRGQWKISQASLDHHDNSILETINGMVAAHDTLWILGDFCLRDPKKAAQYRQRIRCKNVHLVWGNHDPLTLAPLFSSTLEQGVVNVQGQPIWLNHYPMRSWNGSFYGAWHLYGHVHGRLQAEDAAKPYTLTKDVGVDACNYQPLSFEVLHDLMQPRVRAFEERKARFIAGEEVEFVE
jgi:calcineurin-like phosphoesterase family protein